MLRHMLSNLSSSFSDTDIFLPRSFVCTSWTFPPGFWQIINSVLSKCWFRPCPYSFWVFSLKWCHRRSTWLILSSWWVTSVNRSSVTFFNTLQLSNVCKTYITTFMISTPILQELNGGSTLNSFNKITFFCVLVKSFSNKSNDGFAINKPFLSLSLHKTQSILFL